MDIPTRHKDEDGPVEGYVYLVLRDDETAVKIGSSRNVPSVRLAGTPSCNRDGFLIACWTTAVRELEYYLHEHFTDRGRKLPGKDNFYLTVEDVLLLAYWFNEGSFIDDHTDLVAELLLVDASGEPVDTRSAFSSLVGRAVRTILSWESRQQERRVKKNGRRTARTFNVGGPDPCGEKGRGMKAGQFVRRQFTYSPDTLEDIIKIAGDLGVAEAEVARWCIERGIRALQEGERPEMVPVEQMKLARP